MNNDGALYIISKLAIVARNICKIREEQFNNEIENASRRVIAIMKDYCESDDTASPEG